MDVLKRLPFVKQMPYIISLQRRIDAACRGHIRWLEWVRKPWLTLDSTESLLGSGCFAANYWVNGQIMPDSSGSWQSHDAIRDTPFQTLKVTTYIKWFQKSENIQSLEDERLRHHMALLRDVWVCLIHELDDMDKRKACAWHHKREDGLNTHRLDDHVWVWRSLNELHYLDLWNLADLGSKPWKESSNQWISSIYSLSPAATRDNKVLAFIPKAVRDREVFAEFSSKARRLLPKDVQRAVLQRFTVENDVSQERMLAVTRSAQETRFFFHTRDTALFYGHDRKFFRPDTSFGELWERTIRSQSHHEEALQEEWSSPLRFVLGAVAGLSGSSIDKRSPVELTKTSVEDLMRTSANNAFIPGEIGVATRGPSLFSKEEDRDYYYHVGFEACHVLLAHARGINMAFQSEQMRLALPAATAKQVEDSNSQPHQEMNETVLKQILAELKKQTMDKQRMANRPHLSDNRALTDVFGGEGRLDRKHTSMVMKRSMPFNNMIDVSSITTSDEEWLYNYPDFLLTKDIDLRHELKLLFDNDSKRYKPVYESVSSIIDKALDSLGETAPEKFSFAAVQGAPYVQQGLVASLPKQKIRRQKRGNKGFGTYFANLMTPNLNERLWSSLRQARYAINAKKRFVWLPQRSNSQTALVCWLPSTEAEKSALSLFFDRHAGYENHVWDDTTMVTNAWQTELHSKQLFTCHLWPRVVRLINHFSLQTLRAVLWPATHTYLYSHEIAEFERYSVLLGHLQSKPTTPRRTTTSNCGALGQGQ